MTFWNDLLSALAQFSLFSSSTAAPSVLAGFVSTTTATTAAGAAAAATSTPISPSTGAFHEALKSHDRARDNLKQSINHSRPSYDDLLSGSELSGSNASATMLSDVRMASIPPTTPSSINETLLIGASHYNNFTADGMLNNLVDCNDFTEQKLLNIVICSISDVNSNLINGSIAAENSTFNETLRNISDDLVRLYNFNNSFYYNETDVTGNTTNATAINGWDFESTLYFIQVITTAVVLGIIILATVIGE